MRQPSVTRELEPIVAANGIACHPAVWRWSPAELGKRPREFAPKRMPFPECLLFIGDDATIDGLTIPSGSWCN